MSNDNPTIACGLAERGSPGYPLQDLGFNSPGPHCGRVLNGIEKLYSSAMRIAAPALIQDPLTLDVILNAPALTHQGWVLARDRIRHLSRKRRQPPRSPG